jgi:hypothetical protein
MRISTRTRWTMVQWSYRVREKQTGGLEIVERGSESFWRATSPDEEHLYLVVVYRTVPLHIGDLTTSAVQYSLTELRIGYD